MLKNYDIPLTSLEAQQHSLHPLVETIKQSLMTQPAPDALTTTQAALFPLLHVCGLNIWHPATFRSAGLASSNEVRYTLTLQDERVSFDMHAVSYPLPGHINPDALDPEASLHIRSNGRDWQLIDTRNDPPTINTTSLYSSGFLPAWLALFEAGLKLLPQRLDEALVCLQTDSVSQAIEKMIRTLGMSVVRERISNPDTDLTAFLREQHVLPEDETQAPDLSEAQLRLLLDLHLQATDLGFVRSAAPLQRMSLADVRRHAEPVSHLKGDVTALFDGAPVPVYSRSSFYFVLAALAVQYGREDAIPVEDLLRPPDTKPESARSLPLGKPGYYLLMHRDRHVTEQAIVQLLDRLNLRERFVAERLGKPFPARP